MQIRCSGCQGILNVNPAGGQFRCPNCQTVNLVAAPVVGQGHPHLPFASPQQQQPLTRTPPKKTDNRTAIAVSAFVVLGMFSMFVGWWGVGLGVLLLAWAVAAVLGKVKGPMALLYPESIGKTALAAAGVGLALFVTMCGAMGSVAQEEIARKEADRQAAIEADKAAKGAGCQRREAEV